VETPFLVCIDTVIEGRVAAVRDGEENPIIFHSLEEAQREIVENMIDRLQEFLDGDRDFEDAICLEEFAVPVSIANDGMITDADGNCYF